MQTSPWREEGRCFLAWVLEMPPGQGISECVQVSTRLDDFTGNGKFVLCFELKARLCGKCPVLTTLFQGFKRCCGYVENDLIRPSIGETLAYIFSW